MRTRVRRCPELEVLDARALLSRLGAALGPDVAGHSLQLVGSVQGVALDHGDIPTFVLTGEVSPLGKVKAAGGGSKVNGPSSIVVLTGTNGSFNLITPQGRVYVATDVSATGPRSFAGVYTIQGGTGLYSGATGTGPYTVSYFATRFAAHFG
jgi:hypothetical protein